MKLKLLSILFVFTVTQTLIAQNNYYVSQEIGSDTNSGDSPQSPYKTVDKALTSLDPGDTLFMMGEYTNTSFNPNYSYSNNINDPHIWHQENTIRINNLNGTPSKYITITSFDDNTVLKGDGANIFRMTNCSYLRIENLHLYGEVEKIPLSTALALQFLYRENGSTNSQYRVPPGTSDSEVENMTFPKLSNIKRPSYTDTRGIYLSNVHHIDLTNNLVHHVPGNGFRVAKGDYINIIDNEIHNTSRKSYSGTHGLVVTNAESFDSNTGYKIFIQRNLVHHNYNEIYSWAPTKDKITPRIDEGKGISLQRNDLENGWTHGRILVENNLTYWNGYSGIHSNTGYRIDFVNNTSYMNSYTNTITYAGGDQRGNNIGASASNGEDIKFINNLIFIDNSWGGFPISIAGTANIEVSNNLIFGINGNLSEDSDVKPIQTNTIKSDPLFVDAENLDFSLQSNSPAIGAASNAFAPSNDFFGNNRDSNPDIGAVEFSSTLSLDSFSDNSISVYPNPFNDKIHIKSNTAPEIFELYSISGQKIHVKNTEKYGNSLRLDVSGLAHGIYILKLNAISYKLVKQ